MTDQVEHKLTIEEETELGQTVYRPTCACGWRYQYAFRQQVGAQNIFNGHVVNPENRSMASDDSADTDQA